MYHILFVVRVNVVSFEFCRFLIGVWEMIDDRNNTFGVYNANFALHLFLEKKTIV